MNKSELIDAIAESAELTKADAGLSYYTFNISSGTPGIAEIEAVVDDTITLKQKINVKFTE